ncbi:MAG: hypothetical protein KFB93_06365 [Simkaniaceae bacterium]|nr:MAG: hypothetical protein KFB93_06365 [Simkaniaceae bacterium]
MVEPIGEACSENCYCEPVEETQQSIREVKGGVSSKRMVLSQSLRKSQRVRQGTGDIT